MTRKTKLLAIGLDAAEQSLIRRWMDSGDLPTLAISARGLDKVYRGNGGDGVHALKAIDLDVPRGGIFGLLGPNGAGKSTFINILAGLVIKTAGTAKVWDIDIDRNSRAVRAAIGVVPQELNLDAFFTPRELLELQAGLYGVPPRERHTTEILERVGLTDRAAHYPRQLSGGQLRRVGACRRTGAINSRRPTCAATTVRGARAVCCSRPGLRRPG